MCDKVAVVTGANKGIGFAIVRGFCKRFSGIIYLTSRNVERGKNAVCELNKEDLYPAYHQLDITDICSVIRFRDYLMEKHGGFDILVNNAGIYLNDIDTEPVLKDVEETLNVNYFSLVSTCEILFPILRNGGRVVNMSSKVCFLSFIRCEELRERLKDPNLNVEQLSELMMEYIEAVKRGKYQDWHNSGYVVSKVGVTALTKIHQRMLDCRDIKVNAVHPGYVNTDMSSYKGEVSPDEGAVAPLYLALDAPDCIRGQFVWYDKTVVDWDKAVEK